MTIGNYILSKNLSADPVEDWIFAHEYGHTKQSIRLGPLYMIAVGIPSLIGSVFDDIGIHEHNREWYERWANQLSYDYHKRYGYEDVITNWSEENPRTQDLDWFFIWTLLYYLSISAIVL